MTIAVSEVLKQAAFLSSAEQMELAARLTEQARQSAAAEPPVSAEAGDGEAEEPWFSLSKLNRLPLNQAVTMRIRVRYKGRLKPLPYDLPAEEVEDEEASLPGTSEVNHDSCNQ